MQVRVLPTIGHHTRACCKRITAWTTVVNPLTGFANVVSVLEHDDFPVVCRLASNQEKANGHMRVRVLPTGPVDQIIFKLWQKCVDTQSH